jgi:hypothetical protein
MNGRFEVNAEYYQFYLMDDERQPRIPDPVLREDMSRRVRVAPHIVVVHTASNTKVPVSVEVLAHAPSEDLSNWDHVAEFSLDLPSGRVVLAGCTDYLAACPRIVTAPGSYRGRVFSAGLSERASERYRVALWPGAAQEPTVLKQHIEHAS